MSSGVSDPTGLGGCHIATLDELKGASKAIVVTHEHPDGDALGSLIAMQHVLMALGHDCLLFIAESDLPLPREYGFLPLDGHISAAPADLEKRTIVFLDCGNIHRNPGAEVLRPLQGWGRTINIDHHHDNTHFGGVNFVDPGASCTAEIVWGFAAALDVELTPTMAMALYVGLITDTGCFMYENTGPRAHRMAADLIEAGVDVHAIYRQVYEGVPFGKLALLARGLLNVESYDEGRLMASQLSAEDFNATDAEESYAEGVIDHLRAVRGTAMAVLVRDRLEPSGEPSVTADGSRIRKVSLRASDMRIDVSAIAHVQAGGGHRAAAGFNTALGWDQLIDFLREQLDAQLRSLPGGP